MMPPPDSEMVRECSPTLHSGEMGTVMFNSSVGLSGVGMPVLMSVEFKAGKSDHGR